VGERDGWKEGRDIVCRERRNTLSARASQDSLQAPRPCHEKGVIYCKTNSFQTRGTRPSRTPSKSQKETRSQKKAVVRHTSFWACLSLICLEGMHLFWHGSLRKSSTGMDHLRFTHAGLDMYVYIVVVVGWRRKEKGEEHLFLLHIYTHSHTRTHSPRG